MMQNSSHVLRIAIVGCGQIADAHLQELRKLPSVEVVATCDSLVDMAMQAAMRFGVPRFYDDVRAMLRHEKPDIVHVTTPAHTHADLAREILSAGVHVYVEKPLALNERQVRELLSVAQINGRKVCVGHDQLFDPSWLELRKRVDRGEIGEVRHVESTLGYPISGQFGRAVCADAQHWVRRLPGGLFQNTISHPLYRITELLPDEEPEVMARWWTYPGTDFPTELLVHLRGRSVTGTLTFNSRIAAQRCTRVHGSLGTLECDLDAQTVVRIAPASMPGALGKLDAPWHRRREATRALRVNVWRFIRSDIHYFAGMGKLFQAFHHSVRNPNAPLPISENEMLRITRLMDQVFDICRRGDEDDRSVQSQSNPGALAGPGSDLIIAGVA